MISIAQLNKKYGLPTKEGANLVMIKLPYPMRIAWETQTSVTKMRCHKLVADNFLAVFKEILEVYGLPKIQELGIDLLGGCFNYRLIRGGTQLSRHSWGVAIDLSPTLNAMNTPVAKAQFNKPEYLPMIAIFEKHGFNWAGDMWKKDAMHFEISS